jgi:hypothetical protein
MYVNFQFLYSTVNLPEDVPSNFSTSCTLWSSDFLYYKLSSYLPTYVAACTLYFVIFCSLFTGVFLFSVHWNISSTLISWFSGLCSPKHFLHPHRDFLASVHRNISSTFIVIFRSLFIGTFLAPLSWVSVLCSLKHFRFPYTVSFSIHCPATFKFLTKKTDGSSYAVNGLLFGRRHKHLSLAHC